MVIETDELISSIEQDDHDVDIMMLTNISTRGELERSLNSLPQVLINKVDNYEFRILHEIFIAR